MRGHFCGSWWDRSNQYRIRIIGFSGITIWILGHEKLSTRVDVGFLHHEKLVRKWKNGTEVERCWWLIELNYLSPDTKQIFLTCRFVITRYKCLNSRYDNTVIFTLSYNFEFCPVSLGGCMFWVNMSVRADMKAQENIQA